MIEFVRSQVVDETDLIFNFLSIHVLRIGGNSDGKSLFGSMLQSSESLKCRILGCLEKFPNVNVPELLYNLSNFFVIEYNLSFKQSHFWLLK